jgi:hypothetical protein
MIPLSEVQVVNGPNDVLSFTPTSRITELEFRRGSLHLRHSKETSWPPVMIETAEQQATFWVLAQIGGQWHAAGMERLRPNQQDKPEGDDPTGFIAGFVEGRNFGAFNGHTFQRGDRVGFMVVQGDTRLNTNAPLRERSLIVEAAFPPDGRILWTEGDPVVPDPLPLPLPPPPPAPTTPTNLQAVLDELEGIKRTLANVATKEDVRQVREEFMSAVQQVSATLPFFKKP